MFMFVIKYLYPLPSNLPFDADHYVIHNAGDFVLTVDSMSFKPCVKLAASNKDLPFYFEARQIP
jgi:hypothetical protein